MLMSARIRRILRLIRTLRRVVARTASPFPQQRCDRRTTYTGSAWPAWLTRTCRWYVSRRGRPPAPPQHPAPSVIGDPSWPAPLPDRAILSAIARAGLDRTEAEECLSWVRFQQATGNRFTGSDVAVWHWTQALGRPMPTHAPWEIQP